MQLPRAIHDVLEKTATYINHSTQVNTAVSAASVSWHLSHSYKVLIAVGSTLQKTNPTEFKREYSIKKFIAMLAGYFPRGKAKAPKYVLPEKEFSQEELNTLLEEVKAVWSAVPTLPKNAYIKHHLFGHLNKVEAIRFGVIHTNHHLKIIRDILGNR